MNRQTVGKLFAGTLMLLASTLAFAADLAGTWRGSVNGEAATLELRKDGSGAFNGAALNWQVQLGMLFLESDGEVQAYSFSIDGNRMQVAGGDLAAPVTLERGKAAAAAPAAPVAPAPANKRGAGGVQQALVGKWCYVGTFSANMGGGSQTEKCFVLNADGSYSYNYESSISAYSNGNSGLYGATNSSSGDSGRWTATADSLTAQSNSGGSTTYPLQLRNHPKFRDPMICLDGECYVTQYQKAPW